MLGYATSVDTVYKVARQLNESLDLEEVLGKVLRVTVEATGALRGSLFLMDDSGQVVSQILSRPNQSPEIMERNIKLAMDEGLAGWVFIHKQGALAADAIIDDRWVQMPDDPEVTGSAIVVPLLYQDRINGILALHHSEVRFFDESHLALAVGIASQAAIAVENARLFTEVKRERESLYALINAMPVPVLELDEQDNLVFANLRAKQTLSANGNNIPLQDIHGGPALYAALAEIKGRDEPTIEVEWPDGRVFNVAVNQVPRLGTVVTLDDITHFKELDEMKSQFVETVSHDLKNPLSAIVGFSQLLQYDDSLSDNSRAGISKILEGAQQMNALIEDLLDLARIEAGMVGQLEPCSMLDIIEEALETFQPQAEQKNLNLISEVPARLPEVSGEALRLSQVANNLVSNAIKYTPDGGRVTVTLSHKGPEVWFQVADTGPGISPASQSQLFQKFYRVPEIKDEYGHIAGTGLGLSIVKAIVEGYSGRVWVESEVGRGSTFGCALIRWAGEDGA